MIIFQSSESGASLPFIVGFLIFWLSICFFLSRLSGWASLASHYARERPPTGKKYYMQSMGSGYSAFFLVNYSSCLTIHISEDSLFLKTWWMFKISHTPLEIPHKDITVVPAKFLFFKYSKLTLKRTPKVKVHLYGGASHHLLQIT